jgi:DNA-binding protein VF530
LRPFLIGIAALCRTGGGELAQPAGEGVERAIHRLSLAVQPPIVGVNPTIDAMTIEPSPRSRDPLHGMTLEAIVTALVAHYGWDGLGERIPVRCFTSDPSMTSSLKFLRKTPWAREKVEGLYLFMLRELRRA